MDPAANSDTWLTSARLILHRRSLVVLARPHRCIRASLGGLGTISQPKFSGAFDGYLLDGCTEPRGLCVVAILPAQVAHVLPRAAQVALVGHPIGHVINLQAAFRCLCGVVKTLHTLHTTYYILHTLGTITG